jgi:hypothetical protein
MVGSVIPVIAMLDAPSFVSSTEKIEDCSLFRASRSLGDAADKREPA